MSELEYINCPLCKSSSWEQVYIGKDYLFSKKEFTIVQCNSCGLLFTNPRISKDKIGNYYFKDYSPYKIKSNKGLMWIIKAKLNYIFKDNRHRILNSLESIDAKNILEIGPGSGSLLFFLKEHGFNVTGVEIDNECVKQIRENDIPCYLGDFNDIADEIASQKFDAIIFHHVFEHVYDPISTLNNAYNIVKKNGIIYLSLPNSDSIEARLFGKYWVGFDLPRHVIHYNKETIEQMLCKGNFKIKRIITAVYPSSIVESIGFCFFKKHRMPEILYLTLYYSFKLLQSFSIRFIDSGIIEIIAIKKS